MALHYEPDKIIQLVQLCCWRERIETTQNALVDLAEKLSPNKELNDRYIVDLLSDARKAAKAGGTIKKNEPQITVLLNHVGFSHWDEWKDALRRPGNFLAPEDDQFDLSDEKSVAVIVPQHLEKQLTATLTFVKKTQPIEQLSFREETLPELATYAFTQLEQSAVVICALPLSWKDQAGKMRNPAWGEFSRTKRILPVWIDVDDAWNPVAPYLPVVKQEQSTAGIPGVLTGLLFVENYVKHGADAQQNNTSKRHSEENAPRFINSKVGLYMQGGTIRQVNTAENQTINVNLS
jgi:hypothetical protein